LDGVFTLLSVSIINQQLTISKRTNSTVLFLGTAAAEEKMFGLEKHQVLERRHIPHQQFAKIVFKLSFK
jgi:hypothetical protein